MDEEDKIFIKSLENKLNVTDYNNISKIIEKYVNTANYNRIQYERIENILKYEKQTTRDLESALKGKERQIKIIGEKYDKSLQEVIELEYKLDKECLKNK